MCSPAELLSLSLSLSYIITRVAPHCVNTLRILHAAYDATNTTRPLVNTHSDLSLSLSLSLSYVISLSLSLSLS